MFAGNECIQYKKFSGDTKGALNIIVHGTWNEGTDTLARYAPFAEDLAMRTDITTIAVALTGYSGSSTNKFPSLSHKGVESLGAKKDYDANTLQRIKSLMEYDVEFIACKNTMETMKWTEKDFIDGIDLKNPTDMYLLWSAAQAVP